MRLVLRTLSVVAAISLFLVRPVRGRWDIPQTVGPAEGTHSSPAKVTIPTPTPTPVPLPDQAQVPVLMYHYVSALPPNPDGIRRDLTVSPENFEAQLQYLAEAGYHAITLTDLALHLTQGYPLPEKPIILTFDDGYSDAYKVVFPLLLDYGFTATFFVLATPAHFEYASARRGRRQRRSCPPANVFPSEGPTTAVFFHHTSRFGGGFRSGNRRCYPHGHRRRIKD